ncbi:hypothetical protein INR49_004897 [Caranx melampygus]|nr:hypothetical protein INR49_004897 [Caranx melampygus]
MSKTDCKLPGSMLKLVNSNSISEFWGAKIMKVQVMLLGYSLGKFATRSCSRVNQSVLIGYRVGRVHPHIWSVPECDQKLQQSEPVRPDRLQSGQSPPPHLICARMVSFTPSSMSYMCCFIPTAIHRLRQSNETRVH